MLIKAKLKQAKKLEDDLQETLTATDWDGFLGIPELLVPVCEIQAELIRSITKTKKLITYLEKKDATKD